MTDNNDLKGLGGWLILVGLGIVISPIGLLATLVPRYKPIFEDGTWEALTTAGSEVYNPYFSSLLVGEITVNTIIVAASIYLIYLFFSKHYLFPKLYIGIIGASLIFILLDAWLVTKVFPGEPMFDPETTKEFMKSLFPGVIWIPYMLVSKRVRVTFVESMPNAQISRPLNSSVSHKVNQKKMKNILNKKIIAHCEICKSDTIHLRSAYWSHVVASLVISFWLIIWSFLKTKSTCTTCSTETKNNRHFKYIWFMSLISLVIFTSLGAGLGAMTDIVNNAVNNANIFGIILTEEKINQRGIETFVVHVIFKLILLTAFFTILIVRLKVTKNNLGDMVWLTRITVITLALSGFALVILKALLT